MSPMILTSSAPADLMTRRKKVSEATASARMSFLMDACRLLRSSLAGVLPLAWLPRPASSRTMTESGLSSSALTSSGNVFRLGIDLCPLLRLSHAMRKLHGELAVILGTATFGVIHRDGCAKTHGLGQQRILSDNGITD